jgi:DNA-binding CsgD family transcriptional regulator
MSDMRSVIEVVVDGEVVSVIEILANGENASARRPELVLREFQPDDEDEKQPHDEAGIRRLTKREIEVLDLIAAGHSTREVAARLFISPKTVRNHLASVYRKLDARNRTEAVLSGLQLGIVRRR